jgi:hypothetical protein
MLGRKEYTGEELDHARDTVEQQLQDGEPSVEV